MIVFIDDGKTPLTKSQKFVFGLLLAVCWVLLLALLSFIGYIGFCLVAGVVPFN